MPEIKRIKEQIGALYHWLCCDKATWTGWKDWLASVSPDHQALPWLAACIDLQRVWQSEDNNSLQAVSGGVCCLSSQISNVTYSELSGDMQKIKIKVRHDETNKIIVDKTFKGTEMNPTWTHRLTDGLTCLQIFLVWFFGFNVCYRGHIWADADSRRRGNDAGCHGHMGKWQTGKSFNSVLITENEYYCSLRVGWSTYYKLKFGTSN